VAELTIDNGAGAAARSNVVKSPANIENAIDNNPSFRFQLRLNGTNEICDSYQNIDQVIVPNIEGYGAPSGFNDLR